MKKENKNPFIKQVVIGFGLLILVFILNGVSSFVNVNTLGKLISTIYQHPLEVSNASLKTSLGIIKIHRSMKDLVLTEDSTQLQHDINYITEDEKRVYEGLDIIQSKILGSKGQELAKTARQLFADWKPIREEVIALVNNEERDKAALITQGKGADHVFLLEQSMSDLTSYARNKADGFVSQAVTVQKRVSALVTIFVALGSFISLAIAFFTIKEVMSSFAIRSRYQKNLQESEQRFRLLVENVPDSIFLFDKHGKFIDANKQACKTLGYTLDELQNLSVTDIDTKFSSKDVTQVTTEILSNSKTTIVQGVHQHKDGSTFPVEIHVAMMKIEGQPLYFALAHDITNRLRAAAVLQQEASLGQIIENSLNEIYIFAADTLKFIQVNKGGRENIGYSLEELQNLTPVDIKPEFTQEFFEETIKPLKDNEIEKLVFETWHQRKDGSKYPVEIHLQKATYQDSQVFIAIIVDISQRRRSEEAVRISQQRLELALEGGDLGMWDWNLQTNAVYFSPRYLSMLGYGPMELPHTLETWEKLLHPEDREGAKQQIRNYLEKTPPTKWSIEFRLQAKNGQYVWILGRGKVVEHSQDGTPLRAVGTHLDITEQKRLEEELFQAHKMEAIGTLAGGIAHDFNNILSAIIGFSELAKDDIPADSNAINDIDKVIISSRRAADLVQQILTFSRKSDQRLEPMALHLIIKESLKMLRSTFPTTINIVEDIDTECGKIMADPTSIHQIIVNLCTNSLHAMENEKGVLRVNLQRKEISAEEITGESGVSPGPFIVLEVSDTGNGIDQATIERIFEPYFTTKEVGKGTGLGLAVIHGIIYDYHGFIRVKSEPGQGTTFYVHIPALQQEISTTHETEPTEPLPTGTERILVVDDENMIVDMNKTVLERLGYKVSATTESLDALEKIRTDPDQFDLIITDQTMPNLTGAELAQKIMKIKPNMPIILCTGYSSVLTEEYALAIGIKKYARKPVNRTMLAQLVRQVLDKN